MRRYLNFVLDLRSGASGRFMVSVHSSPAGDGEGPVTGTKLPRSWSREAPDCLLRNLVPGSAPRQQRVTPKEIGNELYQALLPDPVRGLYEKSVEIADCQEAGLRLHILLNPRDQAVRFLQGLPWELLYRQDRDEFLSLAPSTPIVRSLSVLRPPSVPRLPANFRVLAARALPDGMRALDLKGELTSISSEIGPDRLEVVTRLADLRPSLAEKGPFHVLHFLGHGEFLDSTEEGMLAFEKADGSQDLISGSTLATTLLDYPTLQLVVLNACETARPSWRADGHAFGGVAAALYRAGLPAVLAMQEVVRDECAIALSRAFYRALRRQESIEEAVAEARQAVYALKHDGFDWAVPSLFLRVSTNGPDPRRRPPEEPSPEERTEAGISLFLSSDYKGARRTLQDVLTRNPALEKARLFALLSRMALASPLPIAAAQEIDAALQPLQQAADPETASLARLALGILRLDVAQPRHLRVAGTPSQQLFADLETSSRTELEKKVARALRASRDAVMLFNL